MRRLFAVAATVLIATPVAADEFTAAIEQFYRTNVATWANDPVLIAAVTAQNSETMSFNQTEIDALDSAWRAEIGQAETPTISPVLSGPAAEYLRERVAEADGRITQVFVMDAVGLNVAASDVTSDFWQGDEAKFTETFGNGPGGFHISDVELDDSTQRYQGQVSFTLVDPATGEPIGAITVGVDAEAIM